MRLGSLRASLKQLSLKVSLGTLSHECMQEPDGDRSSRIPRLGIRQLTH